MEEIAQLNNYCLEKKRMEKVHIVCPTRYCKKIASIEQKLC
jgi:hypothetical protein